MIKSKKHLSLLSNQKEPHYQKLVSVTAMNALFRIAGFQSAINIGTYRD
jgi:hypothetical protein